LISKIKLADPLISKIKLADPLISKIKLADPLICLDLRDATKDRVSKTEQPL